MKRKIGVIGLGYVGLPLAIAFARNFPDVIGFDINTEKVSELHQGFDRTGEIEVEDLQKTKLHITSDISELAAVNFYVVAVPTPIDKAKRPDMKALIGASELVGKVLSPGDIVVYESTVYPGVTEEICGPVLERVSGLKREKDFKLGYSPERINPGDKVHRLEKIKKIVSGQDPETLEIVAQVYGTIVEVGVHKAPSIKVAEAAKVIENTQRDLNIALMNELSIIFDKMGIRTADVLAAAGTKWNFLPFRPGLVGGHCIGVDPYYLTYKAEELGYHPQVILSGRLINDSMGKYVAEQTVKFLSLAGKNLAEAKVGIFGITFKENVPDLRNSRVPDIIKELQEYGIMAYVIDPLADSLEARIEYGVNLSGDEEIKSLDAVIMAVAHDEFINRGARYFIEKFSNNKGIFIDVKSVFRPADFSSNIRYWSL